MGSKERPTQPIFFNNCKNIKFDNIYILNSPCWTVTFSNCDGIEVEGIYIDNHPRIPNNDGLHFTASKNITVKDSTFLCAAIRFGHLYSKVRNANVRNIKVSGSSRAVCVFAGNGGIDSMSRIYSGNWWGKGEGFVLCSDYTDGRISGVTFKNCDFKQENPSIIAGENVLNVKIENCGFVPVLGNAHPYYSNKLDLAPNLRNLCNEEFISRNSEIFVFNGEHDNIEIIGTECGVDFKEGKHI